VFARAGHRDVAADNEECRDKDEPIAIGGDAERNERARDEELIRDGVEHPTKARDEVPATGELSVEKVGKHAIDEEDEGYAPGDKRFEDGAGIDCTCRGENAPDYERDH